MTPLSAKKLFLFDIDGTIAVGDTLYPGTRPMLDYIQSIGGKAYYITNNSTKSSADYVKNSGMFSAWRPAGSNSSPPVI